MIEYLNIINLGRNIDTAQDEAEAALGKLQDAEHLTTSERKRLRRAINEVSLLLNVGMFRQCRQTLKSGNLTDEQRRGIEAYKNLAEAKAERLGDKEKIRG